MNERSSQEQIVRGLAVPVIADNVLSPDVCYDPGCLGSAVFFTTEDSRYGRVTFQKLDSLRVCRGEYFPYRTGWEGSSGYSWVSVVENSRWLLERHAYEAKHYRNCYEWGGDVDEMLTDYSHYLFKFHDEYVEAIALGIWLEGSDLDFLDEELEDDHPLGQLPETTVKERLKHNGRVCQVRVNPAPEKLLIQRAKLCDQPIIDFVLEDYPFKRSRFQLCLRNRNGPIRSVFDDSFGTTIRKFDGIAALEDVRPYVVNWMNQLGPIE